MRILLIDGANLHLAAKSIGLSIDYKKLLSLFTEGQKKYRAYFFTAIPSRDVQSKIHKLVDWLGYNGFITVTKQYKEFVTERYTDTPDGPRYEKIINIKGNMDIELALHGLRLCEQADDVFIFSGDGDFAPVVSEMQQRSKAKITCVSAMNFCSLDLRKQCDDFISLETIANEIRQEKKRD